MTTRGLIFWSVQAAGDVATSAVRDDHRVGSDSAIDDQLHLILIAGTDHDVRQSRYITGPYPQQVSQRLAIRVHNPIKIILYDVLRADGLRELRAIGR